jgi:hypothetical protein
MALDKRSFARGFFFLELDGEHKYGGSYLKEVHWGAVKGSVLAEPIGPDHTKFKHIGSFETEPIQFDIGMAESKPVLEWIKRSWSRDFSRLSGCISHLDFDCKTRHQQEFFEALILETTFPTLDGSSTESAYLTVKLLPEFLKDKDGDGQVLQPATTVDLQAATEHQKKWVSSNFRLNIEGVDCRYVNKVESFSVTQKVKPLLFGSSRMPEIEPTGIEFSEVSVTLALAHAQDFIDWHRTVIVEGKKDINAEREGFLEYLAPNHEDVLFTVNFERMGIHSLDVEKGQANESSIKRVKVTMFVESMTLDYGSGLT